jgi:hypothetical protein
VLLTKERANATYADLVAEYAKLGSDFGSVTVDRAFARLSCHTPEQMWFDIIRSYGDIGEFLCELLFQTEDPLPWSCNYHFAAGLSLLGIVLYFVTSSDSGSLVIDCLSANGDPDPPRVQRVFWALMEGATATALLVAGSNGGLVALQTTGLIAGLPYAFLTSFICVSIWRTVKVATGDLDPRGPVFSVGLFDAFGTNPYRELTERDLDLFLGFLKNVFWAPMTIANVNRRLKGSKGSWFMTVASLSTFLLCILFHLLELSFRGSWAIAWFWYLCFASVMASLRLEVREILGIAGSAVEDFFASLLLYPCCALQLDLSTTPMTKVNSDKA